MTDIDKDELWAECESKGEGEVRISIARGSYNQAKLSLVLEWLRRQEDARNEASISEQRRIARSANKAAWTAAIAAIIAAVMATVPLLI
ncbi:MAG: hypothetical protein K9M17_03765 [Mariprofundaceae bacterium]|nr:hypothetical protein [Mariprofundaceae bacterium]